MRTATEKTFEQMHRCVTWAMLLMFLSGLVGCWRSSAPEQKAASNELIKKFAAQAGSSRKSTTVIEQLAGAIGNRPPQLDSSLTAEVFADQKVILQELKLVMERGPYFMCELKTDTSGERPRLDLMVERCRPTYDIERLLTGIALSRDGQLLVAGHEGGSIEIWAAGVTSSGKYEEVPPIARIKGYPSSIGAMAIWPDAKQLACGHADGTLLLRDLETGKLLRACTSLPQAAVRLAFSGDGHSLLATSSDAGASVYDVSSGLMLWRAPNCPVACCTHRGDDAIALTVDSGVELRDTRTGDFLALLDRPGKLVVGLAFTPDGQSLAVCDGEKDDRSRRISLINLATGEVCETDAVNHSGEMTAFPGGRAVACFDDSGCEIWDVPQNILVGRIHETRINEVVVGGDYFAGILGLDVFDVGMLMNLPTRRALCELCDFEPRIFGDVLALEDFKSPDDLNSVAELAVSTRVTLTSVAARDESLAKLSGNRHVTDVLLCDAEYLTDAGLAHLAAMPQLRRIDLGAAKMVTDAGLAHLAGLKNLERLNLDGTPLTTAGLAHLAQLIELKTLSMLGESKMGDTDLVHLAGLTKLRSLHLNKLTVSDAGLKNLAAMIEMRELDLQGDGFNGEGLRHLAGMSDLEVLRLEHGESLTDEGLSHMPVWPKLQTLDLRDAEQLTSSSMKSIARLKSLVDLDLSSSDHMTSTGFAPLQELKSLERINVSSCQNLNGEGLEALAHCPKVTTLDLSGTELTDRGLKSIAAIKQLKILEIHGTEITDTGLTELIALSNLSEFSCDAFFSVKGPGLVALARARGLKSLDFIRSGADHTIARQLTDLPELRELALPRDTTDKDLEVVARLPALVELKLFETSLSLAGWSYLRQMPSLRRLEATGCEIDDKTLHVLKHCTQLEHIALFNCGVSEQRLDDLRYGFGEFAMEFASIQSGEDNNRSVLDMAFSPDGRLLVCAHYESLEVIDVNTRRILRTIRHEPGFRGKIIFLPDAKSIYVSDGKWDTVQVDIEKGQLFGKVDFKVEEFTHPSNLRIGLGGTRFVATKSKDLLIGDFPFSNRVATFPLELERRFLNFDSTGRYFILGGWHKYALWDLQKEQQLREWTTSDEVENAELSPDAKLLVVCTSNGRQFIVRDVATDTILWRDLGAGGRISPDGKFVVIIGGMRRETAIHDAVTGTRLRKYRGHHESATKLAISADSRTLATADDDGVIKLWEMPPPLGPTK